MLTDLLGLTKRTRHPADLARAAGDAALQLWAAHGASTSSAAIELTKHMAAMKLMLYGEGPEQPPDKQLVLELAREVLRTNLFALILPQLPALDFECRKDITQIFSSLLRKQHDGDHITVSWVEEHPETMGTLLRGYAQPEVAINYGTMFRECVRHERLARLVLPWPVPAPPAVVPVTNPPPSCPTTGSVGSAQQQSNMGEQSSADKETSFYVLFDFVESPFFDVASDAFASLKDVLTKHKTLSGQFLEASPNFFDIYMRLVTSNNYVTRRQSLKLLGELLLDRSNFTTMTRFISSVDRLRTIMNLLRDRSSSIQYEAFHVFKIFVANPRKDPRVRDVLMRNREKLISFMSEFQNERADEQFAEEKKFIISEIANLA